MFVLLRQKPWLWLIPLLLVASFIGFANAQTHMFWFDEMLSVFYSGVYEHGPFTLLEALYRTAKSGGWPPLYYVFYRYWNAVAGDSLLSARTFSLYFGLLEISVMYCLGRRLLGTKGAIIAASIMGTSAFFAYYYHELRAYTLMALALSLVFYFYWRLLHERNFLKKRWSWAFSLSIAMSLYTFSGTGIYLLTVLLYHIILEWPSRSQNPLMNTKRWWAIARAWLNGCLFFAPYLGVVFWTVQGVSQAEQARPLAILLPETITIFTNGLTWLFVPVFLLGFWSKSREIRYLVFLLLVGFILLLASNIYLRYLFHPRHFIGIFPAFTLLLTAGILRLKSYQAQLAWAVFGIFIGSGLVNSFVPAFMDGIPSHARGLPYETYQGIRETIESCVSSDDYVVFAVDNYPKESEDISLLFYFAYGDEGVQFSRLSQLGAASETELEPLMASPRIWLFNRPSLGFNVEVMQLDNSLQSRGYISCGAIRDEDELEVWAYSNAESCEAFVQSCQP